MKKLFTTFFLLIIGYVFSWAQVYTVNVTPNNSARGKVVIEEEFDYENVDYPQGSIKGAFSVSPTKKVAFSQGNLQYQASTDTWRFAEHQYDYIGEDNENISTTYNGWIDLFGRGTGNCPTKGLDGEYNAFVDWGENKISNGGNVFYAWFTLSNDEWNYLLKNRPNASTKQGVASVNGINGLVLLPDNWILPTGLSFIPGYAVTDGSEYYRTVNTYTISGWRKMESAGAVFLPAAGYRPVMTTSTFDIGKYGFYGGCKSNIGETGSLTFSSKGLGFLFAVSGKSVRLCSEILDKETVNFGLSSISNITLNGAIITAEVTSDGGTTITERGVCYGITTNPKASSSNKVKNGSGVGSYTCTLTGLKGNTTYYVRPYVRNAIGIYYGEEISFTTVRYEGGKLPGRFSVSADKQVKFSQGNLQYQASTDTWRFAAHQYDYVHPFWNESISSFYKGWIDLFGWGTGNNPTYKRSWRDGDYSTYVDWGVNNIINANQTDEWRTLTVEEWNYLISRDVPCCKATIEGVNNGLDAYGMIIFPDYWVCPEGIDYHVAVDYTTNIYDKTQWTKMESAGAVFLPAAGFRTQAPFDFYGEPLNVIANSPLGIDSDGVYWSETNYDSDDACYMCFCTNEITPYTSNTKFRDEGYSVRLCSELKSNSEPEHPQGPLNGKFSVSPTKKVAFSQGNLQYQARSGIWRFAEHQYDMVGKTNSHISPFYSGWIDLFGWGTGNNPTNNSTDENDYMSFVDWGVNNISNDGNQEGQWRTLTDSEWHYLLFTRSTSLRSLATVNGVAGLIILPDDWEKPAGLRYTVTLVGYTTNTYSLAQWTAMEASGAVFLPAAGYRNPDGIFGVGTVGSYWSSTHYFDTNSRAVSFSSGSVSSSKSVGSRAGLSVRLVKDIE